MADRATLLSAESETISYTFESSMKLSGGPVFAFALRDLVAVAVVVPFISKISFELSSTARNREVPW